MTQYRRKVFNDAMLTFCEHGVCAVCADLDTEQVELNGQSHHVHLLAAYAPTLSIIKHYIGRARPVQAPRYARR